LLKNASLERFYVSGNKVFACQSKSPAAI
jgi:hypothetical protein